MSGTDLPWRTLADAVLVMHAGIVVFVVGGLVAILAGRGAVRRRADSPWFRGAHALAVGIVVAEAWLGIACPLTTLEGWLRVRAGDPLAGGGFVERWVGALLYWQAPAWVFTLGYTLFGLLVVVAWRRRPPVRRRSPGRD